MKVICKCCHKAFDYDMYMGLCPQCGRVYRRGRNHYSEVERDMMGEFHLDADDAGLNRGIDGVVYNQGSEGAVTTRVNGFDEDMPVRPPKPYSTVNTGSQFNAGSASGLYKAGSASGSYKSGAVKGNPYGSASTPKEVIESIRTSQANGYFSPDHKTKINQQITKKKNNNSVGIIVFILIVLISMIMSMFD